MIEKYWQEFLQKNNKPLDTKYYADFSFGNTQELADELLELVLTGEKTATTSAEEEYLILGEKEPKIGDYSIVTDFAGTPKCVIETKEVLKLKFKEMTFDICRLEGEDSVLETWQSGHKKLFEEVGKEVGYQFDPEMMLVFEKFKVVDRASLN